MKRPADYEDKRQRFETRFLSSCTHHSSTRSTHASGRRWTRTTRRCALNSSRRDGAQRRNRYVVVGRSRSDNGEENTSNILFSERFDIIDDVTLTASA